MKLIILLISTSLLIQSCKNEDSSSKEIIKDITPTEQIVELNVESNNETLEKDINCIPDSGLENPINECSVEEPCINLLGLYSLSNPPTTKLEGRSQLSQCKTLLSSTIRGYKYFDDGPPKSIYLGVGDVRQWCEFRPSYISFDNPKPLVIFFTGSGGSALTVYNSTSLRDKAQNSILSTDVNNKGFVLMSVQARNLHWPTVDPQDGSKFDTYFRDYKQNSDIKFIDKIIDDIVDEGVIDPSQIYVMGWSNGARFAAMYGLHRYNNATPRGNYISAIANYSGGDPYGNISFGLSPSCKVEPYPKSNIPFFLLSRSCDGVTCNQEQMNHFKASGTKMTPGNNASEWIANLKNKSENPNVKWQLIDESGNEVNKCTSISLCDINKATINHVRWPDGIADGGKKDWEPSMMNFLKSKHRYFDLPDFESHMFPINKQMVENVISANVNEEIIFHLVGKTKNGLGMLWYWNEESPIELKYGSPEKFTVIVYPKTTPIKEFAVKKIVMKFTTPGTYLYGHRLRDAKYWDIDGDIHQSVIKRFSILVK